MNKKLLTFALSFFICVTALLPSSSARSESIISKSIQVFHPRIRNIVNIEQETFSYKTLVSKDSKEVISVTEITQPPQYKGFLLRKHVVQTPEEMYITDGEFEIIFSETDKKIKVGTGDVVSIPAGLPFGFRHLSRGEGKVKIVSHSDALPNMLAEIGAFSERNAAAPDLKTIGLIAEKYGIEYLN